MWTEEYKRKSRRMCEGYTSPNIFFSIEIKQNNGDGIKFQLSIWYSDQCIMASVGEANLNRHSVCGKLVHNKNHILVQVQLHVRCSH
ncbi:hypothetical protein GDO78_000563 [Eleutherodactylus coqui]|uniref:Uncharacterized protein n=1 Tax=Eleutherodactylus coqui TaxID=57060 RepID=A0A8J6FRE9_ELECQ|nr:hypothetical protein GDO78_000563 [Eleutherodactylus coqui]